MTRSLASGASSLLLASLLGASPFAQADSIQRSFRGETIRLELSGGNYRITASSDDRIRVTPRTKTDQVSTRISLSPLGNRATVQVVGPRDGFDADIQLPTRVDVEVELAAGSLQMGGVEGSKDVAAKAADIEIALGERPTYRRVTASVQNGELTVSAFDQYTRGTFFEWTGKGAHDLRVRLDKGRITLKR